jgi:hypothetical protein
MLVNGSMGPANHDTQYGTVPDGWTPFVVSGNPPQFTWVDNEAIDPGGAQQIHSNDTFDAGVYQTVHNLQAGMVYMLRLGYSLAAKSITGPNVRVGTIGRKIGVDLKGGTDPKSPNISWGPDLFDGKRALNCPEMQMVFVAQGKDATIFLRAMAQDGTQGENRVWFDAVCMEPRPDIPAASVPQPAQPAQPAQPSQPAQPAQPSQALQDAVMARANAAKPWMPVNNTAALWQYAQAHGLQDQQTDELSFTYNGDNYICQVFNLGIVYVKVGDWGNMQVIRK